MWQWVLVSIVTTVIDYFFISMSVITSVLVENFLVGLLYITFNYLAHYFWSFESEADHGKSGS
jgi:hypothetical protein